MFTPDPYQQALLDALNNIATKMSHSYTITGAADWPILMVAGGLIVAMVAFMWRDLRSLLKENKVEWQKALADHKIDNEKEINNLWSAMRDCKDDCCSRKEPR